MKSAIIADHARATFILICGLNVRNLIVRHAADNNLRA
jgi:hypothetical protein